MALMSSHSDWYDVIGCAIRLIRRKYSNPESESISATEAKRMKAMVMTARMPNSKPVVTRIKMEIVNGLQRMLTCKIFTPSHNFVDDACFAALWIDPAFVAINGRDDDDCQLLQRVQSARTIRL